MGATASKVVIVTGASSGIGRAVAEYLHRTGHQVFGAQRRSVAGDTSGVESIQMDVTDDGSVAAAVEAVLGRAGRIDAVVNNAGNAIMGAVEDTSVEEAKAQFEPNLFGVLRVCRAVLPAMRARGSGHIINISSLAGIIGLPFSGLYSASKFALEGMTEALRLETRRFGIKVALIEPGDFRTELATLRITVKGAGAASAYAESFARFKTQQEKDESAATTPEPVAQLVERILNDPNPALRHSVGKIDQRIVVPLKRLLPQRWFEAALVRVMGL